jgi:hypothetical protein
MAARRSSSTPSVYACMLRTAVLMVRTMGDGECFDPDEPAAASARRMDGRPAEPECAPWWHLHGQGSQDRPPTSSTRIRDLNSA